MTWYPDGPMGNEAEKIKYDIVPYTRGRGLDLGSGPFKPYRHFISVDNHSEYGGIDYSPDIYGDCTDLSLFADNSMDFVFSSHLLEHIEGYESVLKEWWRVIRVGGYLVLYLPHKDHYPNIGEDGSNPDHVHDFCNEDIINALKKCGGWELLVNEERSQDYEYSFLQVFQKREDKQQIIHEPDEDQPKRACVVRYGGFGDMMQTSSVIAGLKELGYNVSLMTHTGAWSLMKDDPHIDGFILQDKEQVPNAELSAFWDVWAKKFDAFVNLSESVEGTFLALPGRTQHRWPHEARHKALNKNYMEFAHDLAGLEYNFNVKFYPTKEEKAWARKQIKKIGGPVVLMPLAGSSVHKSWPHMDQFIAMMMLETKAKIVLVGDDFCKILEQGWDEEPRVFCRSGEWGIRKTLAFAQECDVIVGPETGVLNCCSNEPNKKVVLLSHSSSENLTKHWENTVSIEPVKTPCFPCHMMHYGWQHCTAVVDSEERPFSALCAYNISAERVFNAVKEAL